MTRSSSVRYEIEKFANDRFAITREHIHADYAARQNKALREVRLRGNVGGELPERTRLAAERVREEILALVDAYVEAFTLYNLRSDAKAESAVAHAARHIAAGTIAGTQGQLDLIGRRTGRHLNDATGHLERQVQASMKSALQEGALRLRRQAVAVRSLAMAADESTRPEVLLNRMARVPGQSDLKSRKWVIVWVPVVELAVGGLGALGTWWPYLVWWVSHGFRFR